VTYFVTPGYKHLGKGAEFCHGATRQTLNILMFDNSIPL